MIDENMNLKYKENVWRGAMVAEFARALSQACKLEYSMAQELGSLKFVSMQLI